MTVGTLIEILSKHDSSLPVVLLDISTDDDNDAIYFIDHSAVAIEDATIQATEETQKTLTIQFKNKQLPMI